MSTGLAKSTSFSPFPVMGSGEGKRGDRRAEYLLVIYPYGDLNEKLLDEQQQFAIDYGLQMTTPMSGGPAGLAPGRNKPHITVAAFQAGEMMEDTLIRWIQRICNRHRSFDITLNNYSGIPPHTIKLPEAACPPGQTSMVCREYSNLPWQGISGTIYLRVQDPQPFRELMRQLRAIDDFIRSSGCPPVNLVNRPYLSIAGGLTEHLYNKAMPDYSRRTFHESFQVEELVLLKREHSFDPCKTVNIFRLLPETSEAWSASTDSRSSGFSDLPSSRMLDSHTTESPDPYTSGISDPFPA